MSSLGPSDAELSQRLVNPYGPSFTVAPRDVFPDYGFIVEHGPQELFGQNFHSTGEYTGHTISAVSETSTQRDANTIRDSINASPNVTHTHYRESRTGETNYLTMGSYVSGTLSLECGTANISGQNNANPKLNHNYYQNSHPRGLAAGQTVYSSASNTRSLAYGGTWHMGAPINVSPGNGPINTNSSVVHTDHLNGYTGKQVSGVTTSSSTSRTQPPEDETNIVSGFINANPNVDDAKPPQRRRRRHGPVSSCTTPSTRISSKASSQAMPYKKRTRTRGSLSVPDETPLNLCPYVDKRSGDRCTKEDSVVDWETTRHWSSVHLLKEAREILEGKRKIEEATLVTSESALKKAKEKLFRCQTCKIYFCRKDVLVRHARGHRA